jgi:hypothetical protein
VAANSLGAVLEITRHLTTTPTLHVAMSTCCCCCPGLTAATPPPPPVAFPTQGVLASGGEDHLVVLWSLDRTRPGAGAAPEGGAGGSSSSGRGAKTAPPPEVIFKHVGHRNGVRGHRGATVKGGGGHGAVHHHASAGLGRRKGVLVGNALQDAPQAWPKQLLCRAAVPSCCCSANHANNKPSIPVGMPC